MAHARRQKPHTTSALGTFAAREAQAALRAPSCARALDRLSLASFYAGQAVASDRKRSDGKSGAGVVRMLKKARAHVASACARGAGTGAAPAGETRRRKKRTKWKGYNK